MCSRIVGMLALVAVTGVVGLRTHQAFAQAQEASALAALPRLEAKTTCASANSTNMWVVTMYLRQSRDYDSWSAFSGPGTVPYALCNE